MAKSRKMNVLQQFPVRRGDAHAQAHADAAGEQGKDVRGAGEKIGGIGDAGEALFNLLLCGLR